MSGAKVFPTLIALLTAAIKRWPDPRKGTNKRLSLPDLALAAFGCFFFQCPSFLAFQRLMQQGRGFNNAQTLFGVEQLPTDNQIRNILDSITPEHLQPVFHDTFEVLQQRNLVESFRCFQNTHLIALDGTGYFHSHTIKCPSCTVKQHRNGQVSYSHSALLPALVQPGCPHVIPLQPEFIVPQDGHDKQDCELVAGKRWLAAAGPRYSALASTLLADSLFAVQPFIELVTDQGMDFIFVSKSSAHKHLYEEIKAFEQLREVAVLSRTQWTGKHRLTLTYRYLNGVNLNAKPDSISVNWAALTVTDENATVTAQYAFISSHAITAANVEHLIEAGRCRWKIENENNNTLKTKGYHFEHNFGHGKKHLSATLLSLNLLAFLFHTVLELTDIQCAQLRQALPRRDTFFQHIATLTHYLCFFSWDSLLTFMIRALKDGPRPPPDLFTIIR